MGDDREFEDAREITSGTETVWSQDPSKKSCGLSDGGKILTIASTTEDKEPTTPVPPSNGEVQSSQTVAGMSQFSYVVSTSISICNAVSSSCLHRLHLNRTHILIF